MKPGHVFKTFTAKDGTLVTLRAPRWEDLDDLLAYINGLVDEGADIVRDQPIPRAQEAEWLGRTLAKIEMDKSIWIVVEVDGRVIANAGVTREKGYLQRLSEQQCLEYADGQWTATQEALDHIKKYFGDDRRG